MPSFAARILMIICFGVQLIPAMAESPQGGQILRVVQFNFQRANLYTPDGKAAGRSLDDAILLLKDLKPDLMNINEIDEPQAEKIAKAIGCNLVFGPAKRMGDSYGAALFSRFPVLEHNVYHGEGVSEEAFRCVELLTECAGNRIRFFGTHPRFNDRPIKLVQMMELMNRISATTGTRILCGDFNDMDNRPNWYSHKGFINLITGGIHGTYLNSIPKFYDFQRKCAIAEQTKYNPPYYGLKTDWSGPDNTANSISQWAPKVRIDHIFVSPNFFLDDARNRCETIDTLPLLRKLDPQGKPRIVGDHRVVVAEMLMPKPVHKLIAFPDLEPLALPVGAQYRLRVGGLDDDGNGVSLYDTDTSEPAGDPEKTGRIRSIVDYSVSGNAIALTPDPFPWDYDAYLKNDRPSAASATIKALIPGNAEITIKAGKAMIKLNVVVLAKGALYETIEDKQRKLAN
jgi:endonuclease/exonuclease/phosphatase family metal-dependent hydrolase